MTFPEIRQELRDMKEQHRFQRLELANGIITGAWSRHKISRAIGRLNDTAELIELIETLTEDEEPAGYQIGIGG